MTLSMPRQYRPCPCELCRGVAVLKRQWQRHAERIARGELQRWRGEAGDDPLLQNSPPPPAPPAPEAPPNPCTRFAIQLTELVARNLVSVTGAEAMLKITHDAVQGMLPDECEFNVPSSWHRCKKLALDGVEPKWFARDFCPVCDFLYDDTRPLQTSCPVSGCTGKRFDARGRPARQAFYFCLDDKIKRLFGARLTADMLNHPAKPRDTRSPDMREQADSWDGALLQVCVCVLEWKGTPYLNGMKYLIRYA